MAITIIGLALLYFLGHALNWFFSVTKVPDLLILVGIGFFLGPMTGIIQPSDLGRVGEVLSTVALVVILYEGGIHLKARELFSSTLPAALITLIAFALIVSLSAVVAVLIGLQSWPMAILLGLCVGSTSSAIVIPLVRKLSIQGKVKTILSLESAFNDVLTIIGAIVVVEAIAANQFSSESLWQGLGPNSLISIVFGVASGLLWAFVKKHFQFIHLQVFSGEAWALFTYGITEFYGFNGAIGALALGFTLANLDIIPWVFRKLFAAEGISPQELVLLNEASFLLRTFFFLYAGLMIRFASLSNIIAAVAITFLVFFTRYVAVRSVLWPRFGYGRLDAMVAAVTGPRGLACAVVATIPVQRGLEGGQWIQDTAFAVIPLTIFFSAFLVALSERPRFRQRMEGLFGAYPNH